MININDGSVTVFSIPSVGPQADLSVGDDTGEVSEETRSYLLPDKRDLIAQILGISSCY